MCNIFQDGRSINNTEVRFLNDRQQLHVDGANENDAGRYSCAATVFEKLFHNIPFNYYYSRIRSDAPKRISSSPCSVSCCSILFIRMRICFAVPPTMHDAPTVIEIPENETQTLQCPVNELAVTIKWLKNGVPVTTSDNIQVRSSLVILRL